MKLFELGRGRIEEVCHRLYRTLHQEDLIRKDLDEETTAYLISRTVFSITTSCVLESDRVLGREEAIARELGRLVSGYLRPPTNGG